MLREDVQAAIDRFIEEMWNQGNSEVASDLLAPNVVFHEPLQTVRGIRAYRQYIETVKSAFPNARFNQEDLVIEGPKAALRWTLRGTHQGRHPSFPIPATGSRLDMAGLTFFRFEDGKIAEIWMETDYSPIVRIVLGVAAAAFAALVTTVVFIRYLGQLLSPKNVD
jgi:steroid delta-isomerase-like uncharacterized protein